MTYVPVPPAPPQNTGRHRRATVLVLLLALVIAAGSALLLLFAGSSPTHAAPAQPSPHGTGSPVTTSASASPTPPVDPSTDVSPVVHTPTHVTAPPPRPPSTDYGLSVHVSTATGSYRGPCTGTGGSDHITYSAVVSVARGPVTVALQWQFDNHSTAGERTLPAFTGTGPQQQTVEFTSYGFSGTHTGWTQARASIGDATTAQSEQVDWSHTCTTPMLTLTPSGTVAYWDYVTARVAGFLPGERVDLTYDGTSAGMLRGGPVVASSSGAAQLSVHAILPRGGYTVHAYGETSHTTADTALTIT